MMDPSLKQEFTTRGPALALASLFMAVLIVVLLSRLPRSTLTTIVLSGAAALLMVVSAAASYGFRYTIEGDGVHIRTLLGTVDRIPREALLTCQSATIRPLREFGGWGIRGSRHRRAYVLAGGVGVQIRTAERSVFLETENPVGLCDAVERSRQP